MVFVVHSIVVHSNDNKGVGVVNKIPKNQPLDNNKADLAKPKQTPKCFQKLLLILLKKKFLMAD